jgi:hypothetical protein
MDKQTGVTTVAELIALDPWSAGTQSPDNPLAVADLIFARFSDGSEHVVYDRAQSAEIVASGVPARLSKIIARVRDYDPSEISDDDLEVCAQWLFVCGHQDFVSETNH